MVNSLTRMNGDMKAKEEDLRQKLIKKTTEHKEQNLREKLLAKKVQSSSPDTMIPRDGIDASRSHDSLPKASSSSSTPHPLQSSRGGRRGKRRSHQRDRNRLPYHDRSGPYQPSQQGPRGPPYHPSDDNNMMMSQDRYYRDNMRRDHYHRRDHEMHPSSRGDPYYHRSGPDRSRYRMDDFSREGYRASRFGNEIPLRSDRSGSPSYSRRSRSRSRSSRSSRSSDVSYSDATRSRSRSSSSSDSRSISSASFSPSSARNSRQRGSGGGSTSRSHHKSHHQHDQSSRSHPMSPTSSNEQRRKRSRSREPSQPHRSPSETKETSIEDELTKDQRTLFVSQLVMKSDDRDIKKYFRKELDIKVNNVILIVDKRSGRHKGSAYVEIARVEDIPRALEASGKVPNFQRFPILVKASESGGSIAKATVVNTGDESTRIEAQKVYIGNIDQNFTQSQLYAIFSQFGQLDRVMLQLDPATAASKGYAFFSYADPKVANLVIQVMSGQVMGGKPLKTGWANQNSADPNLKEVTSIEFPDDCISRVEKTNVVFKQLNSKSLSQTTGMMLVPEIGNQLLKLNARTLSPDAMNLLVAVIAEEAVNVSMGIALSGAPSSIPLPSKILDERDVVDDPKLVQGNPSRHILVRNMFDKDQETEDGWEDDVRLEFEDEGRKYGKIDFIKVVSKEIGGKIYVSFDSLVAAASCAENLAGRWFDKRQLRVEFVDDAIMSLIQKD